MKSKSSKTRTSHGGLKIAHRTPGRMRFVLPQDMHTDQRNALVEDLKASPQISKVTLRGSSLIIEHNHDDHALTAIGQVLSTAFPSFERWSDQVDAEISKFVADPWITKSLPLGFLGLALFTAFESGAIVAGESALALGYIAFDLYWKFQQENVIRKIERGLSSQQKFEVED